MNRFVIALGAAFALAHPFSAQAVQLADGKSYFVAAPRLLNAATTQNGVYLWGATYYFTLSLPENAGEGLQAVSFTQQEGVDTLRYHLNETSAFIGTRSEAGANLPLKSVTAEPGTRTVTVTFDPPVKPGQTITIGLRPVVNPSSGGVYLFGVTAFPEGEKPHGQFLGFGRLHFYDRFNSLPFPGFLGLFR
jgi:hypothetical protein